MEKKLGSKPQTVNEAPKVTDQLIEAAFRQKRKFKISNMKKN